AATCASDTALRFATFGEFAFCQPEESPASIVIEISAAVCVCHWLSPRELKIPSTESELENTPAAVSLFLFATETIWPTESARCSGESDAVCSKCRDGADPVGRTFLSGSATRNKSASGS